MLTNALYIVIAIVLLGVIIVVHEFGHFIVGRLCGIGVIEFSVGFGPKLLGWRRKETDYSIRAIPLGGYCKFVGEDEENPAPDAMNNASVWKRILTVAAGASMNFVLAFVSAVLLLWLFIPVGTAPKIDRLVEGMPAAQSELREGDIVTAIDGEEIPYSSEGILRLREVLAGQDSVTLTVQRGDEALDVVLEPAVIVDESTGPAAKQVGVQFSYVYRGLGSAIAGAGGYMADVTKQLFGALGDLFFRGEGADQMAGTVGTVVVVSEVMQQDNRMILNILFLLSLNIGIMNLLPLPALDGGRLVFLLIEAVRGKPVPPEKEGVVHGIGMLLLVALFVVLTFHDIQTYILK